jgi:predicted transposase/invertase (TIGR01784 family)
LKRIYLTDLPKAALEKFPLNLLKIVIDSKKKVLSTAEKIIRQLPKQVPDEKQQEIIVELLENLLVNKLPHMPRKEIEKMFEFSDVKKTRFYRDVAEEVAQETSLKEKRKIARTMLKKNFSLELIAEITGLPQKEIRPLTKNVVGRPKQKPITKLDFAASSK